MLDRYGFEKDLEEFVGEGKRQRETPARWSTI